MAARVLYGFTIFASAFLLFQVQPLIARFILPWFGGGPGVWATCLLFFQAVLLAGYGYAHALSRVPSLRAQAAVHSLLLLAALTLLPITPDPEWMPGPGDKPSWRILQLLTATVGLPCFLVSATSPLLQSWFGRTQTASPYRLYAVSNAGSLLGLVSYPFVVEPLVGVVAQTRMWSVGFAVFTAACVACAGVIARTRLPQEGHRDDDDVPSADAPLPLLRWLLLSAFGVILLLAATNELTTNVAPIPFLWVLPLSLYLVTYILCFAGSRFYRRRLWVSVFSLSIVPTMWLAMLWRTIGIVALVVVFAVNLFAGCMVCHGELSRLKPNRRHLTGFYLTIAVGGVAGSAFVTLLAPSVFTRFWELKIAMISIFLLAGWSIARDHDRRHARPMLMTLVWLASATVLLFAGALPIRAERNYIASTRNFHGRVSVNQERVDGRVERTLVYGRIRHGMQIMDEGERRTPTLYYRPGTGIHVAATHLARTRPFRMGVVGLGAGTLATFTRPGDVARYYEINPAVAKLARTHFTFLRDAGAETTVVIGDARMSLAAELAGTGSHSFHLLVMDAFTSEAIPTHLLTREAFAIYAAHMAPGGVLAINITNSSIDLTGVVRAAAADLHADWVVVRTHPTKSSPAGVDWALITTDRTILDHPEVRRAARPRSAARAAVHWTDDYSNLLRVLK